MSSTDKMMKRIELEIIAEKKDRKRTLHLLSMPIRFIYGTSAGGLTELERAIGDLELGSSTAVQVAGNELHSFFGCHFSQLQEKLNMEIGQEIIHVHLTFQQCEEVEPREIVKALSTSLVGGCSSGSCGCGCG